MSAANRWLITRRRLEHRADAPGKPAVVSRREEERRRHVADTERRDIPLKQRRLADERDDDAEDEVPVLVQVQRNDRLHVQDERAQFKRAEVLIPRSEE